MWGGECTEEEAASGRYLSIISPSCLGRGGGAQALLEEIGVRGQRICSHQHPKMPAYCTAAQLAALTSSLGSVKLGRTASAKARGAQFPASGPKYSKYY